MRRKQMAEVDRRLAERRHRVAEEHARSHLNRLLRLLLAAGVIGAGVWMLRSPWMAVARVEIEGVTSSSTRQILQSEGVEPGVPLISVQPEEVVRALAADPWVAEAKVSREWPATVRVAVVERTPVAWAPGSDGWVLLAGDGVLLATAQKIDGRHGVLAVPGAAGTVPITTQVLGGLAFLGQLRPDLAMLARVEIRGGELWADLAGIAVRLGQPYEMEAKARVLAPLIDFGLEPGSTVTLIAPRRPAIQPPAFKAQVEP
jgi:cell division protein FtsQ